MNGLIFGRCKYELWLGQYRYWVALEIIPTPALILHEVYGSNFCTLLGSLPSCTHWQCWLWVRTFAHRHLRSSSGPSSHASKLVTKYSKQLTPTTTPSVKKITPQVYCTSCVLHLHKDCLPIYYGLVSRSPLFFFCFFFVCVQYNTLKWKSSFHVYTKCEPKNKKQKAWERRYFKLRCIWYPLHGNEMFILVCC